MQLLRIFSLILVIIQPIYCDGFYGIYQSATLASGQEHFIRCRAGLGFVPSVDKSKARSQNTRVGVKNSGFTSTCTRINRGLETVPCPLFLFREREREKACLVYDFRFQDEEELEVEQVAPPKTHDLRPSRRKKSNVTLPPKRRSSLAGIFDKCTWNFVKRMARCTREAVC